MILAAHQPNYLPWMGYYHKMKCADIFVVMDNVQFIKRSYINRTQIFGVNGNFYLTIPVGHYTGQKINEVEIIDSFSFNKHIEAIRYSYGKSPNYFNYIDGFCSIFYKGYKKLYDINLELIKYIANILSINTKIVMLSDLKASGSKTNLLLNICKELGTDTYLSGLGAKNYIVEDLFIENNIKLVYQNFQHPVYYQKGEEFKKNLSIVDFIFNCKEFKEIFQNI